MRALLMDSVRGPLDVAVSQQVITESHGNPLALIELPRTWRTAELAGGFGLPESAPVAGKIEQSYVQRLAMLPLETRLHFLQDCSPVSLVVQSYDRKQHGLLEST